MNLFQAILLGITQGVTEFLPVSSSGHLAVVSYFLNIQPSLSFDIFLNSATLLSVFFYFRKDFKDFWNNLPYIIVGSIPAGIVGLLFKSKFETIFGDIRFLPIFFLITAFELFLTRYLRRQSSPMSFMKALLIGTFQAFAILPGVSRSASTIFAGLVLGLSPADAFKYSFYLFIPASAGALLLGIKDSNFTEFLDPVYIIGFLVSSIVGYFALRMLRQILTSRHLWLFAPYVFVLSLLLYLFAR